ncbi:hypothetical protein GCM10009528_15190 [Kineococcus aurantiacus]
MHVPDPQRRHPPQRILVETEIRTTGYIGADDDAGEQVAARWARDDVVAGPADGPEPLVPAARVDTGPGQRPTLDTP